VDELCEEPMRYFPTKTAYAYAWTRHPWLGDEQPDAWRVWNDNLPAGGIICHNGSGNATLPCGRTCTNNCWKDISPKTVTQHKYRKKFKEPLKKNKKHG
jgi:hypothetical protein